MSASSEEEFWEEVDQLPEIRSHRSKPLTQTDILNKKLEQIRLSNMENLNKKKNLLISSSRIETKLEVDKITKYYEKKISKIHKQCEKLESKLTEKDRSILKLNRKKVDQEVLLIRQRNSITHNQKENNRLEPTIINSSLDLKERLLGDILDMYKEQHDHYINRQIEIKQDIASINLNYEQEINYLQKELTEKEKELGELNENNNQELRTFLSEVETERKVNCVLKEKQAEAISNLKKDIVNAKTILSNPRLFHKFRKRITVPSTQQSSKLSLLTHQTNNK